MRTTIELIAMRARQLKRKNEDLKEAKNILERMRRQEKKMFDSAHEMRNEELKNENLILLHDIQHMHDRSSNRKLKYK